MGDNLGPVHLSPFIRQRFQRPVECVPSVRPKSQSTGDSMTNLGEGYP